MALSSWLMGMGVRMPATTSSPLGIGFVLAVKKADACAIVDRFNKHAKRFSVKGIPDMKAYMIGRVAASEKEIRGNVKGNKAMTLFEG